MHYCATNNANFQLTQHSICYVHLQIKQSQARSFHDVAVRYIAVKYMQMKQGVQLKTTNYNSYIRGRNVCKSV